MSDIFIFNGIGLGNSKSGAFSTSKFLSKPTKYILGRNCGSQKSEAFTTFHVKLYHNSPIIDRIVAKVLPLSWFKIWRTFSRKNAFGRLSARILVISKNKFHLPGSANPFLWPLWLNGWQGNQPQTISISGIFSERTWDMSPAKLPLSNNFGDDFLWFNSYVFRACISISEAKTQSAHSSVKAMWKPQIPQNKSAIRNFFFFCIKKACLQK